MLQNDSGDRARAFSANSHFIGLEGPEIGEIEHLDFLVNIDAVEFLEVWEPVVRQLDCAVADKCASGEAKTEVLGSVTG